MKPYKICIFIYAVIAVLACISAVYPEDGIKVGDADITFPSISEMLAVNNTQPVSSDETTSNNTTTLLVDSQLLLLDSLQQIAIAPYQEFFEQAPNRIFFPNNDVAYFDQLYAALENARQKPMRIIHYGDSQIEEDRITKELRLELQNRFGGSGVGLLPFVQNITSLSTSQSSTVTLTRKMAYGPASYRSSDKIYGPLLRMDVLNQPTTTTIASKIADKENLVPANTFTKATILTRPIDKQMTLKISDTVAVVEPDDNQLHMTAKTYSSARKSLSVSASGYGYIYGVMLDDTIGVSVDNVPMRGCSGTIFTQTDPTTMREFYKRTNTQMIIMQFTGNSVPYLSGTKSIAIYVEKIRNQIRFMHRQAPNATILFIGPSDMLQNKDGVRSSYPMLATIDNEMRKMVNEEGAAYWSIFLSMGGKGSMTKWIQSTPALAGKDGIHFTRLGAQKVGEMLTEAIINGYKYYTIRNEYYQTLAEKELEMQCTE